MITINHKIVHHHPASSFLAEMSSTSKIKSAFGGILPPAPLAPYPMSDGMCRMAR